MSTAIDCDYQFVKSQENHLQIVIKGLAMMVMSCLDQQ